MKKLTLELSDSSVLKDYAYFPETQELVVEFPSGKVYVYLNVTPRNWTNFLFSAVGGGSVGRAFNHWIRPKHEFICLD